MINIGIIGYGYWGPNLARNFNNANGCKLTAISDSRSNRLSIAKTTFPGVDTCLDPRLLIESSKIDAVVIATPVSTHFELAKYALSNGKHVMLEKPMTSSVSEAKELIALAEKNNLVLMVDHTFLYSGAVNKIKNLIDLGDLGRVRYFDSTRINLGLFQSDINVLWDLAPHDLSILTFLSSQKPHSVNATGVCHTPNFGENIGFLTVNYSDQLVAHINCSWSSPVKVRRTLVGGDKKMVVYDDIEPTDKVRVYDSGYTIKAGDELNQFLVDYRVGDVYIPKLPMTEPLSLVAKDFIQSIDQSISPVSNSQIGIQVVAILEAAQKSLSNNGEKVLIVDL